MRTEDFTKWILKTKVFDIYVATVFFATSIFFVINSTFYTPLEIIFTIVFVTVLFKGLANVMISMVISLINLSNEQDRVEFEKASDKLDSLVNDLAIQEASVQSHKTINNN